MGRFSPTVLPVRRPGFADALTAAFMESARQYPMLQRQQREDAANEKYRQSSLDLRREELDRTRQTQADEIARQRARDASEGIRYDPDRQFGSAVSLDLPDMPGDIFGVGSHIRAGQRPGTRDLGSGYTLDESMTPTAQKTRADQARVSELADALRGAGVPPGVARAGAAMPQALPYLLPKEAPGYDAATDPATLRERYFQSHGLGRYDPTTRAPRGLSVADESRGAAILNAMGSNGTADDELKRAFWQAWTPALQANPKAPQGALAVNVLSGLRTTLPNLFRAPRVGAPTVGGPPMTATDSILFPERLTGSAPAASRFGGSITRTMERYPEAPAASAPARFGGSITRTMERYPEAPAASAPELPGRSPEADRWETLVNMGMDRDSATAQVRKEFKIP